MRRKAPSIYQRIADSEVQRQLLTRGLNPEQLTTLVSDALKVRDAKGSLFARLAIAVSPIGKEIKESEKKIAALLDDIEGKPPVRG